MKTIVLMLFVTLTITSCSQPEVKYVDRPYKVEVPVKCVIPDVYCDFNKTTNTEVISSLVECITDLKKSIKVCE